MTTKEKAILLIQTLDDDVSLDDVIDRLPVNPTGLPVYPAETSVLGF